MYYIYIKRKENNNIIKLQLLGVPQNTIFQDENNIFKKYLLISFLSYRWINGKYKASLKISLEDARNFINWFNKNHLIIKCYALFKLIFNYQNI